jgi:hypothetical protein
MRPDREFEFVRRLVEQGLNDCETARQTGVPRSTVRGWRAGTQRVSRTRDYAWSRLNQPQYAYLFGLYLGDGHISALHNGVYRLRISLDEWHIHIHMWCIDAIQAVMPGNRVFCVDAPGCRVIGCYSRHWRSLMPQHGAGKKHDRPIVLQPWQQEIVERYPQEFIRGLIHSDGSRFMNRVRVKGKEYAYPRYTFTNHSADIRRLFTDTLDQLGIAWRQMNAVNISVARREAVAALDAFIGPKR